MDFSKLIRKTTGQKEPKDPRKKSRYGRKPEKMRNVGSGKNASFERSRDKRRVDEANEAIRRMRKRKKSKS
jgi:hypothetical protein